MGSVPPRPRTPLLVPLARHVSRPSLILRVNTPPCATRARTKRIVYFSGPTFCVPEQRKIATSSPGYMRVGREVCRHIYIHAACKRVVYRLQTERWRRRSPLCFVYSIFFAGRTETARTIHPSRVRSPAPAAKSYRRSAVFRLPHVCPRRPDR